jgi:putative transposase
LHGSLPGTLRASHPKSSGKAFADIDRELDLSATGPRWLQENGVAQCVADALQFGESQLGLYDLRAWVLMTNHVHILIHPKAPLSRITKAIKNFSARQANALLGRAGQPFWQNESYDHWVRSPDELEKILRYIEENPVAAGLVERVEDWRWSSAFRIPA